MGVIVGITGASGVIYGVETLRLLRELCVPSHLIVSRSAALTLKLETDLALEELRALATRSYPVQDVGAPLASGSFKTAGMIVAPCSIKTLSGIVNCYEENLLIRTAGVCLKEGRKVVLMLRETPLHLGHLRLMVQAAEMGCVVFPPVPAFYTNPTSIDDLVRQSCGRALDQLGLDVSIPRWEGSTPEARPGD